MNAVVRGGQRILLSRARGGWQDCLRAYVVFIDGREVGRIRRGRQLEWAVEPGTHTVKLTVDWCSSESALVTLAPGVDARISCRPGGSGGRGNLGRALADTGQWIELTRC
ncbi:hypothetical protein ABIA32_004493 [Streptacidiphilus sp. MAP12-20]|uniref:hypothetical protein n=1 Tax=Streptacidiphilus sp. MAP12-20 TaxID=3156299 RepID=UPI003517A420